MGFVKLRVIVPEALRVREVTLKELKIDGANGDTLIFITA